jgi:hypothetical protein
MILISQNLISTEQTQWLCGKHSGYTHLCFKSTNLLSSDADIIAASVTTALVE